MYDPYNVLKVIINSKQEINETFSLKSQFTGMYDGGQCACGNSYGKHGAAEEKFCDVKCYNGWANDNCGGNATNAVYRVVRGKSLFLFDLLNPVIIIQWQCKINSKTIKQFLKNCFR